MQHNEVDLSTDRADEHGPLTLFKPVAAYDVSILSPSHPQCEGDVGEAEPADCGRKVNVHGLAQRMEEGHEPHESIPLVSTPAGEGYRIQNGNPRQLQRSLLEKSTRSAVEVREVNKRLPTGCGAGRELINEWRRLALVPALRGLNYGVGFGDSQRSVRRAPFAILRGDLQQDLFDYLRHCICSHEMLAADRGLGLKKSEKASERRSFAKVAWHALPDIPDTTTAFVPHLGARGPALRAPKCVLALVDAFRDVNEAAWCTAAQRLRQAGAGSREELQGLCDLVADALSERRHFGVVELQHCAGQGFEGRWHLDGVTSLLHLAVTLSGQRLLRVQCSPHEGGEDVIEHLALGPGSVYLTSPSTFLHSVLYPATSAENAIVALQLRIFFKPNWCLTKWINTQRDADMFEVASILADVLMTAHIRLPTLDEVRACECM